jgi:3-hydroxybutyryl-CoA dehydrogenase
MPLETIGVVGAGNIGSTLAADLLLHGLRVVVVDLTPDILHRARTNVLTHVRASRLLSNTLPRVDTAEAESRLTLSTSLDDLAGCEFVVENVTEDWEIKKGVYQRLDRLMPAAVCVGVNTSCVSVTRLAALTQRPEQVVGMHFMNPVYLKGTVEVIRGATTSASTLEVANQLLTLLGKTAIVVNDVPGFVSSRVSHVFMNEAAFTLHEGVASASEIDAIFKQCYSHRMGPLETADLIGLDTVMRSLNVLYESFQDSKYRCCPLLRQLVDAGHLGRKTGRGFHRYSQESA